MKDKEIIIDGVDVVECVCYSTFHVVMTGSGLVIKEIENACVPRQKPCFEIKNCLFKKQYKKLKRMEQKNTDLNDEVEALKVAKNFACINLKNYIADNNKLKAENDKLKEENRHYKAELKLSCNELDKSEKWQVFERRKKNEYYTALKEIEKLFKKEYTRPVFRNCFDEYPKECKRCLHDGSCLQQQVLNIIDSTKAEEE